MSVTVSFFRMIGLGICTWVRGALGTRAGLLRPMVAAALLLAAAGQPAWAEPTGAPAPVAEGGEAQDYGLQEEVLWVPSAGPLGAELEVTVFRPRLPGRFPVAVINHGRSPGPAHMQARYRPLQAAYELVRRGYAVVVPMREGFSRSGGVELDGSCDLAANARHQARSVRRAVDWASAQPWADATRNIVMGQSHGGLATLAYGEDPHPGTRLLVNFAGGLRQPNCPNWEESLVEVMGGYGRSNPVPSVWFYGDNDSHFRPAVWRAAHQRYTELGGVAALQAVGRFGSDAHALFGARDGQAVWLPALLDQLSVAQLPTRAEARFDPMGDSIEPRPLRRALADEADRLPVAGPSARQAFLAWLRSTAPKAFAVSDNGKHWASAWGVAKPIAQALEQCERFSGSRCRLFAFNGFVVWGGDSGTD